MTHALELVCVYLAGVLSGFAGLGGYALYKVRAMRRAFRRSAAAPVYGSSSSSSVTVRREL